MRSAFVGLTIGMSLAVPTDTVGQQKPTVRSFALQLAREQIPAGLVASERDWRVAHQPSPGDELRASGLPEILLEFNRSGTGFRAAREGGVVHIRPNEEPAFVRLEMARTVFTLREENVPLARAIMFRAVAALTGREPQGIVGSGIVPGPECQLDRPVRIPGGPISFIALLDSIVEQAPGLAWVVLYHTDAPHNELKLGVLCRTGVYQLITVNP